MKNEPKNKNAKTMEQQQEQKNVCPQQQENKKQK